MSFLDLAKQRCSVRKFQTLPVEEPLLQQILEAGRVAPTGANLQPQRFVVVTSNEVREALKSGVNTFSAPLVIVICADHRASWKRSYDRKDIAEIDATIATTHMMLQAADLGLGSVWICHFDPAVIRRELSLPAQVEPVNILAIGYADGPVKSPDRHGEDRVKLRDLVHQDHWQESP